MDKNAAIFLTSRTVMYRWPVGEWPLARGDAIQAHLTVCGPLKNPTALIARQLTATRPDGGADLPPNP